MVVCSKGFSGVGAAVKLVADLAVKSAERPSELEELVQFLVGHQSESFVSALVFEDSSLLLEFGHVCFFAYYYSTLF